MKLVTGNKVALMQGHSHERLQTAVNCYSFCLFCRRELVKGKSVRTGEAVEINAG